MRQLSFTLSRLVLAVAALGLSQTAAQANWDTPPKGYSYQRLSICPQTYKRYLACDDQMAIFNQAAANARAANRKLLVVFGADWCPWCRVIDGELPKADYLEHSDLKGKVDVVLIALNVKERGKKYNVPSGVAVEDMLKARMVGDKPAGFVPFFTLIDPNRDGVAVGLGNGRFAQVIDNQASYVPTLFRSTLVEGAGIIEELGGRPPGVRR